MGPVKALATATRDRFIDAVAGVTFGVPAGTTFGLVGESGSGKTTLGRSIIGLIAPESGTIRFGGETLPTGSDRALKPWRRDIAMMFQDPIASLSPRLAVRALVTEPFRIHPGAAKRNLEDEANRLLKLVGLDESFAG